MITLSEKMEALEKAATEIMPQLHDDKSIAALTNLIKDTKSRVSRTIKLYGNYKDNNYTLSSGSPRTIDHAIHSLSVTLCNILNNTKVDTYTELRISKGIQHLDSLKNKIF
jgi:hypothetical protein